MIGSARNTQILEVELLHSLYPALFMTYLSDVRRSEYVCLYTSLNHKYQMSYEISSNK